MQMKKLKNEKGVMTIYVAVSVLTFVIILTAVFSISVAVRKQQIKTIMKIKESYEHDLDNKQAVYESRAALEKVTLADLVDKDPINENQIVEDENGNQIVIPANFRVVPHGEDQVKYTYSGDSTKPCVQDGVVIEDSNGNQFVWVPIGDINNKEGDVRGITTTIALGRYTFNNGEPHMEQDAQDYNVPNYIESKYNPQNWTEYYAELSNSSYGNAAALNLSEWISTAQNNKGYYIARYEAGTNDGTTIFSKAGLAVYNWIMQNDASSKAKNMYSYSNDAKVYSDLVNSYAWDTAIVFIQEYSGYSRGSIKYSIENGTTFSNSLQNTGTTEDEVCNIYNMASNALEWVTETCTTNSQMPFTIRGGAYGSNEHSPASRDFCQTFIKIFGNFNNVGDAFSFRVLLYVK